MKTMLFGLMMLMCGNAFAQMEHGNGGDVLLKGQNYYLLDFVEAGIEKTAYISKTVQPGAELLVEIQQKFPLQPALSLGVAKKLAEISLVSPELFVIFKEVLSSYQWSFVDSGLKEIKDANTGLQFPRTSLYQIAIRKGYRVQINKSLFQLLSKTNQVGLIFHEMLYSISYNQSNSDRAREVNGVLFSGDVAQQSLSVLKQYLAYLGVYQSLKTDVQLRKISHTNYAGDLKISAYTQFQSGSPYPTTYITSLPVSSCSNDAEVQKFVTDTCAARKTKANCSQCYSSTAFDPNVIGLSVIGRNTHAAVSEAGTYIDIDGAKILMEFDHEPKALDELSTDEACTIWLTKAVKDLMQEILSKPLVVGTDSLDLSTQK